MKMVMKMCEMNWSPMAIGAASSASKSAPSAAAFFSGNGLLRAAGTMLSSVVSVMAFLMAIRARG